MGWCKNGRMRVHEYMSVQVWEGLCLQDSDYVSMGG